MELKRLVLGVQYDGNCWHGWQTQPHGKTVQDTLERALTAFARTPLSVSCAGRTDAGVHAIEQVVHFDTSLERPAHSWVNGVNSFLPPSIVVLWVHEVKLSDGLDNFHARFSAFARTYQYVVYNQPIRSPMLVQRAGWVFRPLDITKMQAASQYLIGEHDFTAFRAAACQAKSPVKHMYQIDIRQHGNLIVFQLRASAFLHHMVRNIVGSLIYVGNGKHAPEWIAELLQGRDKSLAAPTFMPDGLYLVKIDYDEKWNLPQQKVCTMPDFFCLPNS